MSLLIRGTGSRQPLSEVVLLALTRIGGFLGVSYRPQNRVWRLGELEHPRV